MHEKKTTILIVDDEVQIRKMLNIFLNAADYKIEESDSGRQAARMAASIKPDLILLDLGLPDVDGKEVIAMIREWSSIPIIVLSVRSMDEEIVAAFEHGADDYVTKPFNANVLIARIKSNLRKAAVREAGQTNLTIGDVHIDLLRHEVFVKGEKTFFTPKEYELLRFFMVNHDRILTHRQILEAVWGPAHREDTQYLRVYIRQVRNKIERDSDNPEMIVTEPGIGYRMELPTTDVEAAAA